MGKLTPLGVAIILRAMAHLFISHKFIAQGAYTRRGIFECDFSECPNAVATES